MLHSIAQTDTDLAAVFSRWYTGTQRNIVCTTTLPTPKSLPTVGWIRVVLSQHVDSQQFVDPTLHSIMAELCTLYDPGAPTTLCLPRRLVPVDQARIASYRQLLLSQLLPDQSILLCSPPKHKIWKGSCQDPVPPEFQDKVTLTLSCWGRTSTNPWRY